LNAIFTYSIDKKKELLFLGAPKGNEIVAFYVRPGRKVSSINIQHYIFIGKKKDPLLTCKNRAPNLRS
jgi:hypothetical protein